MVGPHHSILRGFCSIDREKVISPYLISLSRGQGSQYARGARISYFDVMPRLALRMVLSFSQKFCYLVRAQICILEHLINRTTIFIIDFCITDLIKAGESNINNLIWSSPPLILLDNKDLITLSHYIINSRS